MDADFINIIGQVFGVFALIISCIKYFKKRKIDIMRLSIFAYLCYIVHYFLIGALVGSYTLIIALVRDSYIFLREKHHKKHRHRKLYNNASFFVTISAIYLVLIIMNLKNPINTLPLLAGLIYFFFEWFTTNKTTTKFASGLTTLPWLFYDIANFSIPATTTDIIQILASFFGILKDKKLRHNIVKNNHKNLGRKLH